MLLERIEELIKEHSVDAPRECFENSVKAAAYVLSKIEGQTDELLKMLSIDIEVRKELGSGTSDKAFKIFEMVYTKARIGAKLLNVYTNEISYKIKRQISILWNWPLDSIELQTGTFNGGLSNSFTIVLLTQMDKGVYGKIYCKTENDVDSIALSHFDKLDQEHFDEHLQKGKLVLDRYNQLNK